MHALIEGQLYAIAEFHLVVAEVALYLDDRGIRVLSLDGLADGFGHDACGYGARYAVYLGPMALAVKLYLATVGEDDIIAELGEVEVSAYE